MRWTALILFVLLVILQVRLFYGNGSIIEMMSLKKQVAHEKETIQKLTERNEILAAEVQDLKFRLGALEERARTDLGMIKKGETFYQFSQREQK